MTACYAMYISLTAHSSTQFWWVQVLRAPWLIHPTSSFMNTLPKLSRKPRRTVWGCGRSPSKKHQSPGQLTSLRRSSSTPHVLDSTPLATTMITKSRNMSASPTQAAPLSISAPGQSMTNTGGNIPSQLSLWMLAPASNYAPVAQAIRPKLCTGAGTKPPSGIMAAIAPIYQTLLACVFMNIGNCLTKLRLKPTSLTKP